MLHTSPHNTSSTFARSAKKIKQGLIGIVFVLMGWLPQTALAQSSACTANEDLVTFDFGAANATNATGSTRTWAAGSTANTYNVANFGSVGQNTISFTATANASAPFVAPDPSLLTQGNVANALSMNMNPGAPGDGVTLTVVFNRPMDKVRFNMYDVDRQDTNWQDRMRVSGFMNGTATPIPALVPTTPARFTTATVGFANEITTNTDLNCVTTDASCNVQINFTNPVDRISLVFVAGPAFAAPTAQRVAFNDFSYCVPKRDLRVNKTTSTTTFVAGASTTYLLTINNLGGVATTGQTSVTDVISTQGVSFVTPQAPAGWTCGITSTTLPADTANCFTANSIPAGGTAVLTLTVSISPAASSTSVINRAKVYGGGDPNKTLVTSTGPVANCDATNENQSGGGATYFGGVDTTDAGCSFESTSLVKRAFLTVTKTNGNGGTITSGVTTTYTITFANLGPSNAPGAVVLDPVATGLQCNTPTFSSIPTGTITTDPVALSTASFQSTGVSLTPTFPANTTALFVLTCGVTATGLP